MNPFRSGKKYLIVVSILFGVSLSLFSYSLYMPRDPQVSRLVLLYTKAGFIFPDESYPLSKQTLVFYADRLLSRTDNKEIRLETRKYIESLDYNKEHVYKSIDVKSEAAAFYNSDSYLPGESVELDHFRYPNDFYNRFVSFPDMAFLGLSGGVEGESGFYISAGLKREYHPEALPGSNFFISDDNDPAKFENYFMRRGYLAWDTGNFEFRLGRAPVHYGDAKFSTFLPSDRLPWLDTFTYRYKIGPLSLVSYFGTIDSRISDDEELVFIDNGISLTSDEGVVTFINNDSSDEPVLQLDGSDTDYRFEDTIIVNSLHRFVLGYEKLRLGFSAYIIVARENNAIQIGDIFPVFSWHNGVLGSNNMNLVFDAAVTPFPGIYIYGQAAWDDINASDIFGIPDSAVPTIGAYLLGVSATPPLLDGHWPSVSIELGTTHYLWGNYYAYDNWKGSYLSRAIYRYNAQKGNYWMPLTSPYGPGTWWIDGELELANFSGFSFNCGLTYLRFNSEVNLFTTPYEYNPDLEEYDSTASRVYIKTEYSYDLNRNNQLGFRFTPSWYSYKGHQWPEFEIAVSYSSLNISDF